MSTSGILPIKRFQDARGDLYLFAGFRILLLLRNGSLRDFQLSQALLHQFKCLLQAYLAGIFSSILPPLSLIASTRTGTTIS